MNIQQLKLLAGRVRGLLEQANHSIGHNQALDLIAALPGLRTWPEVQAFPDRVAACEMDADSVGRLAFRLKRRLALDLTAGDLLEALNPPGTKTAAADATQVWPAGPKPGVYVTTSQDAINALLVQYEEATDGGLVYAERAGSHWVGSIDLGDNGMWSSGLDRVPSGTLFVVGPLELDQQSWDESSSRLETACLHAQAHNHRMAVLVHTPSQEALHEDLQLMVRSIQPEGDDCDAALVGDVTADGELVSRQPFAGPRPSLKPIAAVAATAALPPATLEALKAAIATRSSGLLLFGSSVIKEHSAIELVAASLPLTEHAGPAARIMPRHRSTPAKDWLVPEEIKQLPFLPSIESAYEQGYRRMIYEPNYTKAERLLEFGEDVLFIAGTYGSDVDSVFMSTMRVSSRLEESELLRLVIALLGVKRIPTKRGEEVVCDLFVMPCDVGPVQPRTLEEIATFLQNGRRLKWEEDIARLLDAGLVTPADVKRALPRDREAIALIGRLGAAKRKSVTTAAKVQTPTML